MDALIVAIVAGDSAFVERTLKRQPEAVTWKVTADRLVESIPHWLYVGDTALHAAAAVLNEGIVDRLLASGASPRAVNRRGATPLHYVCDLRPRSEGVWSPQSQARIIGVLIAAGAAVDWPDKGGATALHRAVRARGVVAVRELLRHGANVTAALRAGGSTPLHLALTGSGASATANTQDEQLEIVRELLAHGADPLRSDARGRSAMSMARSPAMKLALSRSES